MGNSQEYVVINVLSAFFNPVFRADHQAESSDSQLLKQIGVTSYKSLSITAYMDLQKARHFIGKSSKFCKTRLSMAKESVCNHTEERLSATATDE